MSGIVDLLLRDQTKAPGVEKDPADSLPWVEKYRPSDLDSIASQKDIIATGGLWHGVLMGSQTVHRGPQTSASPVLRSSRNGKDDNHHGVCQNALRHNALKYGVGGTWWWSA